MTTNGGSSWSKSVTGTTGAIYVVTGSSRNSLWSVGDNGLLLHSTNGGTSWQLAYGPTSYDLFGLEVVDDSLVWISGDMGTIIRTRGSSPLTSAEPPVRRQPEEPPLSFTLDQNFPNPFNPSTSITYSLSKAGVVRISVFNMLGQELAIICEGQREAGSHRVVFDASGLSGGAYFYRMSFDGTARIKRMSLIR